MSNRVVLVTGGAGYIGSHACKLLAESGWSPVVFDNLVHGHRSAIRWGPLIEADLLDSAAVTAALTQHKPAAVMHFGSLIAVGESVVNPALYYRNNVIGSLNLLSAAQRAGVSCCIFSSSAAVYGVPSRIPIPHDHEIAPINPYGASKAFVEQILRDFDAAYGFRSVSLRYFNAAGADVDGQLGEDHEPETHLIPLLIQGALGRRSEVALFGTDYDTADGTAVRDYVHVLDLVDAHILALDYLLAGGRTCALNLGTGSGNSVRQVAHSVERVSGGRVPLVEKSRRAGDPPMLVSDPSRAMDLLGWRPRFAEIDAIVETAWRWHSP